MTLRDTISDDLMTFYDTSSGFAEVATSGSNEIAGHFFNDFESNDLSDYAEVDDSDPLFRIRESDLTNIVNNELTIRSVNYEVIQQQPNNEGEVILKLHEA